MQMLQSPSVRRCWVWCVLSWVEANLAVWLQEETLQAGITKPILESDSDEHQSEDEDVSAQSESDAGDTSDTDSIQRTDNTYADLLYLKSISLQEVPVGYNKQKHPTSKKILPHSAFPCTSFLKEYNWRWKRQIYIITSTWTHWTKGGPSCLMWLFRKCVCFGQLLCRWGTIRGTLWKITGRHKNILHSLLQKHYETRQILSYTKLSTF